jgi:hypothetical protein
MITECFAALKAMQEGADHRFSLEFPALKCFVTAIAGVVVIP